MSTNSFHSFYVTICWVVAEPGAQFFLFLNIQFPKAASYQRNIVNMLPSTVIIVPCYNEAKRLPVHVFLNFVKKHDHIFFKFINDGSTDKSRQIINNLCRTYPEKLEAIHLPKNVGKGEAVRIGLLHACNNKCDFIGYWDADLSTPLSEINRFILVFKENRGIDAVLGSRVLLLGRMIERKAYRHYIGRVFATIFSHILNIPIYDSQCGAKLFRLTPEFKKIISLPFLTRWLFDVEIISRSLDFSKNQPARIHEEPLLEWTHVADSKLKLSDLPLILSEVYKVWKTYKY